MISGMERGAIEHFLQRLIIRISEEEMVFVAKRVKGLSLRQKQKRLPNTDWYTPVEGRQKIIGYICGKGCLIKTFLSSDMIPKGVRV